MNRVLVTGSSGKLGRAVVAHLAEHGWHVVAADRTPDPARAPWPAPVGTGSITFIRADLNDFGQMLELMTRVDDRHDQIDAVVHLAAIPAPGLQTNSATFANNMVVSHNVFAAARTAGIKNVVWASSETVLGLPFETPPPYVPVDEEYDPRPESTYSLVKTLEETMVAQFCRWQPELKAVGLRFSNVMYPEDYAAFPGYDKDPEARKWNLWGYIDARDGAQAGRLALEYQVPGREVFIIANADTVSDRPNTELLDVAFPDVERRGEIGVHDTLLSIDKARRLLGYEPHHSWRQHVEREG